MPILYHAIQLPLFPSKFCRACEKEKLLLSDFYVSKRNADGYENQCKACKNDTQKAHRAANPEPYRAYHHEWGCKNKERVDQQSRERYFANREKRLEQCKEYQQVHREHRRLTQRRRLDKPENKEKMRMYHVEFREQHPDIVSERNRAWRQANPLKTNQASRRHHARKIAATIGEVSYERILERDNYTCHICGKSVVPKDVHFDHVIPLARSGSHCEDNIKVAHSVCNLRKGSKLMEELTPFQRRGPRNS